MQAIFSSIKSFFVWLSSSFNAFFDWIIKGFSNIWSFFCDLLYWFIDLFRDFINNSLNVLVDAVPDLSPMWDFLYALSPYWHFANEWVALDFAFVCFVGYLYFLCVMIPIKLVIKLFVPTLG